MTWIEENPDASQLARVQAYARSLIGTADTSGSALKEFFGLEDEWDITDEPYEVCVVFDSITMRCECCDWCCDTNDLNPDQYCTECADDDDTEVEYHWQRETGLDVGEIEV